MPGVNFYKDLKSLKLPISEVFQPYYFKDVPPDWFVVISDVKNSTEAVNEGRHNDVNLVAAGSLVVALNIAKEKNIQIPFFFGGDGGTLLVPEQLLNQILAGLSLHNLNTIKNFGLELHIGSKQVKDILSHGHFIKLAKVEFGRGLNKAIVVGDGIKIAERLIKQASKEKNNVVEETNQLNLTGLECRWDRIKPPTEENEIVCYLIESVNPLDQLEVYRNVLFKLDEIYGSIENRSPLSPDRLKLLLNFQKIRKEMLAKYGSWKTNYFTFSFLQTIIGKFFFKYNLNFKNLSGREYLSQLISNADTLVIDGRINTIISGKMDKRMQLLNFLSEQEKKGVLVYGYHISKESVMTCYIENRNAKHIHFVDGADGGYTEAAKKLKLKLKQLSTN
ncbi:MAG: DUF3095 family protein [Chitinophagaceae bacterium]